jgi:hypothetical protein
VDERELRSATANRQANEKGSVCCSQNQLIQSDTKKRELLKNPTKTEEIQEKKNY